MKNTEEENESSGHLGLKHTKGWSETSSSLESFADAVKRSLELVVIH